MKLNTTDCQRRLSQFQQINRIENRTIIKEVTGKRIYVLSVETYNTKYNKIPHIPLVSYRECRKAINKNYKESLFMVFIAHVVSVERSKAIYNSLHIEYIGFMS